ncbi:uncharacterized protein LOC135698431 isoform X2 [Ochlerotatus camptorhynchus]|uniref:uncharacterized protein LOC135698431 isoform X2 n=1 Tax=Ochlerotatus camptorhynchus TaxID=644619 RepID=UPI0031E011DC
MATINDLPNEILLLIFEHVPNKKELTHTCYRWSVLVGHMLHLYIDLTLVDNIGKFLKMKFTRSYQHLTIIGVMLMRAEFHWSGPFLRSKRARYEIDPYEIIRKCLELTRRLEPYLSELSLSFGPTADHILPAFLPRSSPSRLETLTIVFNCWYLQQPEDWAIDQLPLVAKDFKMEVAEMPKLRKLHYEDRRSKGDRMVRRKFFDTIVRNAKGITDITLQCSHYACYPDFRIMRSLSQQLQHVSCVIWPIFTKEFFQLTFPRAETMKLRFAYCTTAPETAIHFFVNADCLTDLTVANVHNSEFFRHGVSKCSQLEKLSINGRHEIAMDGMRSLDKLKELYLYSSQHCTEQNAVPCSQTLEKLVLDRCTVGFSFYSVLASNVPYITELHITGDELFDDECLQAVCTSMVNLRRLKLTLMTFVEDPVTESGFQNIENLCKLEYLYLESCDRGYFSQQENLCPTMFTDWVQKVTAPHIHLKNFRKFNLHNLLDLVLNPNLKELVLEHCGNGIRMADGMKKLKLLKNDVPNVLIISDDW